MEPQEERFWAKVDKAGDCWVFTGAISDGYGKALWNGKFIKAQNIAYGLLVADVPPKAVVRQSCNNRACCNPSHLSLSKRNYSKPSTPEDMARRFWEKVDKSPGHGPNGDCWVWTAGLSVAGYGKFKAGSTVGQYAHRVSYKLSHGEIRDGLFICHKCDHPPCVNPAHLFAGTGFDNMRDKTAKGRHHGHRVTHCPRNHEYTPENTHYYLGRKRRCKQCDIDRQHARPANYMHQMESFTDTFDPAPQPTEQSKKRRPAFRTIQPL